MYRWLENSVILFLLNLNHPSTNRRYKLLNVPWRNLGFACWGKENTKSEPFVILFTQSTIAHCQLCEVTDFTRIQNHLPEIKWTSISIYKQMVSCSMLYYGMGRTKLRSVFPSVRIAPILKSRAIYYKSYGKLVFFSLLNI